MKILLVEDSKLLRITNERTLVKAGYDVISAEDGEEALRCAKEQKPDLILLDLLMPKVSGLEGLTRLKHNRDTAKIPVVALSGLSDKNRQRCSMPGRMNTLKKIPSSPTRGSTDYPKSSKTSYAASTASVA